MSKTSILICLCSILVLVKSLSVPPSCFEPFNGLDCGGIPVHVLFYYKPGSRCEVGIWRGCPTRNKFQDEYECSNTCIYTERARSEEHLNVGNEDDYQLEYVENKKTIDDPAVTTIATDSGYEADDEGGGAGEKDTKEADNEEKAENEEKADNEEKAEDEEKADDENAAIENAEGQNGDDDGNTAPDNENSGDEAIKDAGEGDEETKIETASEGTMEIGSEDIGAN